jgi:DNA primase large subunit
MVFGALRTNREKAEARAKTALERKYGGNAARLDAYNTAPDDERSIEYLERAAMDRYGVLRAIDDARSGGKKDEELKRAIASAEEEYNMRRTTGGTFDAEGAARDATSHFLLRLASCRSEEHRRWFRENELELFKYRYGELSLDAKMEFMRTNGFNDYARASEKEVRERRDDLRDVLMADHEYRQMRRSLSKDGKLGTMEYQRMCEEAASEASSWFVVGFEEVCPLVKSRRAYLIGGNAWIRKETLDQLVFGRFKTMLNKMVAEAITLFKKFEEKEAHRLTPLLKSVHNRRSGSGYDFQGEDGTMSIAGIEATQESFPLCMRQLYKALKEKHHLTHGGRRQLQLYLKGIGLPLDQALVFWKTEFTKSPDCSAEKFEKDYAYGIRHAYGKEGKRVNYTPHACGQCIAADPGVKDAHGCPFKTLTSGVKDNGARLHELLGTLKISGAKSHAIVEKATNMHYQIACGMTFAAIHDGVEIEAGVHTPHQYFHESRKILAPPTASEAVLGDANAQSVAA